MSQALFAAANWFHALATVVFVGHYLLLAVVYLPVLTRERPDGAGLALLSEISKRSRFWLYGALLTFALTGIYLMVIDPGYRGLGDFGNLWSVLMLIKHLLIVVMIGLGFWFNAILRVGPRLVSKSPPVGDFRRQAYLMTIIGGLVLLLTAAAQAL